MSKGLVNSVRILPCQDYRDDPNDRRGAVGTAMWFLTRGPLGAITFKIDTGWMRRPLVDRYVHGGPQLRSDRPGVDGKNTDLWPMGTLVASHSATRDRDHWFSNGVCPWLDGVECYGTVTYGYADKVLALLIEKGDEAVFTELSKCYQEWLGPKGE